jgi:hypothetical protein
MIMLLREFNKRMHGKHSAKCLSHSKYIIHLLINKKEKPFKYEYAKIEGFEIFRKKNIAKQWADNSLRLSYFPHVVNEKSLLTAQIKEVTFQEVTFQEVTCCLDLRV